MLQRIIEAALEDSDIPYQRNAPADFFLPVQQLHIHIVPNDADPRVLDYVRDAVVIRGRHAVNTLAEWIRRGA